MVLVRADLFSQSLDASASSRAMQALGAFIGQTPLNNTFHKTCFFVPIRPAPERGRQMDQAVCRALQLQLNELPGPR